MGKGARGQWKKRARAEFWRKITGISSREHKEALAKKAAKKK